MPDTKVHGILGVTFLFKGDEGQIPELALDAWRRLAEWAEVAKGIGAEGVQMAPTSALNDPEPGVIAGVVIHLGAGFNEVGPCET
jgi:hypothetical protein